MLIGANKYYKQITKTDKQQQKYLKKNNFYKFSFKFKQIFVYNS